MSDGADVVDLFGQGRATRAPVSPMEPTAVRRPTRSCQHARTAVDSKERRVVCKQCGEIVDPINVLCDIADRWDSHKRDLAAAQRETRLAKQRVDDLHTEERRAKGRLRRMKEQERSKERALDRLDAELRAFTPDPKPDRRT